MKYRLDATETSLVAFIAQRPDPSDERVIEVVGRLETAFAKAIATALLGQPTRSKRAKQFAKRLREWVAAL